MASQFGLRGLASRLTLRNTQPILQPRPSRPTPTPALLISTPIARPIASSSALNAKQPLKGGAQNKGKGGKPGKQSKKARKGAAVERDPKVVNFLKTLKLLSPNVIPPPLRMARNRYLRHWTIHRAWLLLRRKTRERRETVLMQQHNSMSKACEELRQTAGPGARGEGYLYRKAMEKIGVYGHHGIPIEYARPQVMTPPKEPWNHEWKR
jgi:large subunit ribosomal protein L40